MTASGGPVRLGLRANPHLPFVLGSPGIPPSEHRPGATVQGTVEVRVGAQPVKAKWIRVEVRKSETVTGAPAPSKGTSPYQHVGKVHLLWKAGDGKEYEVVPARDFRFTIPLPIDDLPPSIHTKNATVRYELVASVCYKGKGGLFRKSTPMTQTTSERIDIVRSDLASSWPKYMASTQQSAQSPDGEVSLIVERPQQAYGPGDPIFVMALLRSMKKQPVVFKALDVSLIETFTPTPQEDPKAKKSKKAPVPTPKSEVVVSERFNVNQTLRPGEEKSFKSSLMVPADRPLLTVRGAKLFGVEYKVVVHAITDKGDIAVQGPCVIGSFNKQVASQIVREIGHVNGLSESSRSHQGTMNSLSGQMFKATPALPPEAMNKQRNGPQPPPPQQYQSSPPQSNPTTPGSTGRFGAAANTIQGFFPRRSSSTTTSTTTTSDFGPTAGDRQVTTMPHPNPSRSNTGSPPVVESLRDKPPAQTVSSKSSKWRPADGVIQESAPTTGGRTATTASSVGTATPTPSNPGIPPAGAPPGYVHAGANGNASSEPFASAAHEKDVQRQRYEEAQQRSGSAANAGGSSSHATPAAAAAVAGVAGVAAGAAFSHSPPPAPGANGPDGQFLSATQEKDRLRYEAAVANRDALAGGAPIAGPAGAPPPAPDEAPISYEELFGNGAPAGTSSAGPSGSAAAGPSGSAGPSNSAGPSGSAGPSSDFAPASSSQPVAGVPEPYMSAAQEKEMMRKRYEEASTRVRRATGVPLGGSPSPPPSSNPGDILQPASPEPDNKPYLSAAEEKDLMRKRYEEATTKVARATGAGSGSYDDRAYSPPMQNAAEVPAQSPEQKLYMSAAEEKEMMRRRYEEATNRVASATGSPAAAMVATGSGREGTASPTPQGSSVPAVYMSAAEEKEMMRKRYEEATRRVATTTGAEMAPVDAEGSSTRANGSGSGSGSAPQGSGSVPAVYMSAAEEKEMMRRRYEEATSRVARATSPSGSSAAPSGAPPAFEDVVGTAAPAQAPKAYMTAAQEKDLMRQRYEQATSRVAGSVGAAGVGAAGGAIGGAVASGSATPSDPAASSSAVPRSSSQQYLSAEEEKAAMRRRYEEANARVARATGSVSPPPAIDDGLLRADSPGLGTPISPGPGVSTLPPQLPPISLLAEPPSPLVPSPLQQINGRYSFLGPQREVEATPAKARPLTHLPPGPAPPVPTRPPQEYIDNLV